VSFTGFDGEGDILYSVHDAVAGMEAGGEVLDVEEWHGW
jgi:hypothetical protein